MSHLFIIRHEAPDLFHHMRGHFANEPEVEVILDRRSQERRQQADRRARARPGPGARDRRYFERRGAQPESWTFPGFVFVAGDLASSG